MTLFLFPFLLKSFFHKQFFSCLQKVVPRALKKKNIINNLPFYLPFFTYCLYFVVFFWIVGFQRSFECVLVVIPWICFRYTFPFSFHLLCCWFTLRNLALGKFSFFLRNLLFFTKFKSVNFF